MDPAPLAQTPAGARGVLPVSLTAASLGLCAVAVVGLTALIAWQGLITFWPARIDEVRLLTGETVLGMAVREEPSAEPGRRVLYRVGNRDLGGTPFRWIEAAAIESVSQPADVVLAERREWGLFIGRLGGDADWSAAQQAAAEGLGRRRAIERLRSGDIADLNGSIGAVRDRVTEARLRRDQPRAASLPRGVWIAVVVAAGLSLLAGVGLLVRGMGRAGAVAGMAALLLAGAGWLERPTPRPAEAESGYARSIARAESELGELTEQFERKTAELRGLEAADAEHRITLLSSDGRLAAESQSLPDRPLLASQVTRLLRPNEVSWWGRLGVYLSRWWEFIATNPREANTEGGVFPVIVGTAVVTLLLTMAVVPLGVIAALYLREYAKQGLIVSLLRIAINNLAGVPSIVYGVFGLGFFCYGVGGFIDGGPDTSSRLPAAGWWALALLAAATAAGSILMGVGGGRRGRWAAAGWIVSALIAGLLVATSPYFDGFFRVKLADGQPTFGSSGLLWASLTLALLTLPVVIVSTEEAIAAVPPSLREGSYGCGASRWQTVRRVVLPGAMPGVMTGAILAMARGAGEVAPLMVVGAVKLAPELPVDDRFPFLFADRSFMHLGFHIYDLGFQSPDSEAARGMVWTTTLLLIVLVVAMNLMAVVLRGRLRRRLAGGHF
jgi:ABC-type phosphate transport system permease subunit